MKLKVEYKHIKFIDISNKFPKRVTQTFDIVNHSNDKLGKVEWYSPWRQYVFSPNSHIAISAVYSDNVFAISCLADIITFIEQLKEQRRIDKATQTKRRTNAV